MRMLRAAGTTAGALLVAGIALAAGDVPTRYSGSFPSTARLTGITGTFTGARLVLKGRNPRGMALTGRYTCTQTSPTQSSCDGTLAADAGSYSSKHNVVITWAAGKPVSMVGTH
jgi:hypothetical protein